MSNKNLSVIIVNYRSEKFLENCLASVFSKIPSSVSFEVIICNNDLPQKIESIQKKYPEVRIINSQKNIGFGAGANLGARSASGKVLLFLNPDAEIFSKNIEEVLQNFDADPSLGALGGKVLTSDEKIQTWSAGFETSFFDLIRNNLNFPKSQKIWESQEARMTDWVSGTGLFVRREIFEKINGFDENIFMYFEDMDLCKRIRQLGKKVIFFPKFSIKHASGKSYADEKQKKADYYASQDYYFQKHKNFLEKIVFRIIRKIFRAK
jgi:GT2 family glycosyltransferase